MKFLICLSAIIVILSCQKKKDFFCLSDGNTTSVFKGRLSERAKIHLFEPNHFVYFQSIKKDSENAFLHTNSISEYTIEYNSQEYAIEPNVGWSRYAKYENTNYGVLYSNWCRDSAPLSVCGNTFTITDHVSFHFQAILDESYFSIDGDTTNFKKLKNLIKNKNIQK